MRNLLPSGLFHPCISVSCSYKSVSSPIADTCHYISEFPQYPYKKALVSGDPVPLHGAEELCRVNHMRMAKFPDAASFEPITNAVGKTGKSLHFQLIHANVLVDK